MDVQRLEQQVVQQTMQAQLAEEQAARREAARVARRRQRLEASRSEVRTGEDIDGRWLELAAVEVDWPMATWLRPWAGMVCAAVATPFALVLGSWVGGVLALIAFVASMALTVRQEFSYPARLLVTPRGFWVLWVGRRPLRAGRLEDLRVRIGTYREDSAAHGMHFVALSDGEGRLCESDQLVSLGPRHIHTFAREVGLQIR